jgi:outer membrane receptor for ferrienterochelin and colicins
MKKYFILLACLIFSCQLFSQTVSGTLKNEEGELLFGATIKWKGAKAGVVADANGFFDLPQQDTTAFLQIDYVGYNTVFIEILPTETNLELEIGGISELMTVEVAAKRFDNYVSTIKILNIESVGSGELRKAACCNLSETFQTNAAVDVSYSDAVTGAKEIMMLGLRGTYTQMTIEKRPAMTGLGSAFALEYLPGTWLNSIQISKGTGSVQNGYQAIAGQINAELVKPFEDKSLFVNLYGSTFGRGEANIHLNHKFTDKTSAGLLLHGSTMKNQLDKNNDTFYDTPQKDMFDGMFRLFYRGDVVRTQINVHALTDRHRGGQIVPEGESPIGYYQIGQNHDRVEVFGKMGYIGFEDESKSIGFITNASWHQLDSYYGNRLHQGTQKNFYANWMYATDLSSPDHKITTGASYIYDDYQETLNDTDFGRTENVPGIFLEYTFDHAHEEVCEDEKPETPEKENTFKENFGAVIGLRVDHHNLFGWLVTPRANVSYNFSENSIVRATAGRGFRTANVIAENISILASSRSIKVLDVLDMEDAWNYGLNFTQKFEIGERSGSFSADLFRTTFTNQVVMDTDTDISAVSFYNLNGKSYSNSFLSVLSYELFKGLDIKLAYKFNDVKVTFQDGETRSKPMVAKHRGLVAIDYTFPNEKLDFSVNSQLVGESRFANLIDNPYHTDEQHSGSTSPFALINAHVNYKITDHFEVYVGGENLSNFTQKDPILDWQNPFGEHFDATHIYAPIIGAMGYIGIRYSID